jgi:DNA-binding MarR family transcriptional regulator
MSESLSRRQHIVNPGEHAEKRTPKGEAFAKLAITVLQLAGHLTAAGDALTRPFGQTSARWQVLAAASHASMSVAQIARALGLARQGVQRIADLLEAEGLARYDDNPAHRRAKLLVLTSKGRETLDAIRAKQTVWANALGEGFSEEELRLAAGLLGRVADTLKAEKRADGSA